jgi:MoaA/NifB/PqqE/SkfB family radical SAM enzyme
MTPLPETDISKEILDLNAEEVKKELLSKYPTKVARKRGKQIVVNEVAGDSCVPEIQSNVRTIPGINDHHVPEVAHRMAGLGVDILNYMPVYPTAVVIYKIP